MVECHFELIYWWYQKPAQRSQSIWFHRFVGFSFHYPDIQDHGQSYHEHHFVISMNSCTSISWKNCYQSPHLRTESLSTICFKTNYFGSLVIFFFFSIIFSSSLNIGSLYSFVMMNYVLSWLVLSPFMPPLSFTIVLWFTILNMIVEGSAASSFYSFHLLRTIWCYHDYSDVCWGGQ